MRTRDKNGKQKITNETTKTKICRWMCVVCVRFQRFTMITFHVIMRIEMGDDRSECIRIERWCKCMLSIGFYDTGPIECPSWSTVAFHLYTHAQRTHTYEITNTCTVHTDSNKHLLSVSNDIHDQPKIHTQLMFLVLLLLLMMVLSVSLSLCQLGAIFMIPVCSYLCVSFRLIWCALTARYFRYFNTCKLDEWR